MCLWRTEALANLASARYLSCTYSMVHSSAVADDARLSNCAEPAFLGQLLSEPAPPITPV